MKTIRLKTASWLGAMLLLFVFPMSGLKSISAPHIGVYACKAITVDGKPVGNAPLPSLELKGDGTGVLYCQDATGTTHKYPLVYQREEGANELIFCYQVGEKQLQIPARYEGGELIFTRQLGNRLLVAIFARK